LLVLAGPGNTTTNTLKSGTPTPASIPLNSCSSFSLSGEESTGGASSAPMVRKGARMRCVVVGRESWVGVSFISQDIEKRKEKRREHT
jgi:hypothetical protein